MTNKQEWIVLICVLIGLALVAGLLFVLSKSSSPSNIYDCSDFQTQQEAQQVYKEAGPLDPHWLDGDKDGIACESLP